jgi:hypothetical protein
MIEGGKSRVMSCLVVLRTGISQADNQFSAVRHFFQDKKQQAGKALFRLATRAMSGKTKDVQGGPFSEKKTSTSLPAN